MTGNRDLNAAKAAKRDEFYTQREDVEAELRHYRPHFTAKTVYLNCDDPYESEFFKFFAAQFNALGLKRLIATSYSGSPVAGEHLQLDFAGRGIPEAEKSQAHMIDIREVADHNHDGRVDLADVEWLLRKGGNTWRPLEGNGDFRSSECIELLKQADIVVTNPPFSLFREYITQLIEHGKQFLVIGHQNATKYKEIFPLIQDGRVWLGVNNGGNKWFRVSDDYDHVQTEARNKMEDGVRYISRGDVNWFTNLDHAKRHERLELWKQYTPEAYCTYENHEAINVNKVAEIPEDYHGPMGVPITYLDKHNPEQFEILGVGIANLGLAAGVRPYKPEHREYRKTIQKRGAVDGDLYMVVDGEVTVPYSRILIRRRPS
ncbi:adenine-specific methyltransferase EcoRI family protein [Candidatus Poriferisodalis sp.]|uniref:adenine-specific methyltransferase EcoRI family protein n=1 Tax=Candidatus Poriferisodalis sp. TaxID=3101277 RepID=UPI003B01463F